MQQSSLSKIPNRTYNAGDVIYSIEEPSKNVFLIHSGEVSIETRFGLVIGRLSEGEIFGEVGHIMSKPRTVTARASSRCIIKIIDDETLRLKLQEADPICLALIRGLAMRISDANEAAETYWRELSIYKSLAEKQNPDDQT